MREKRKGRVGRWGENKEQGKQECGDERKKREQAAGEH